VKVLVTGEEGQVARCLALRGGEQGDLELVFAARPEFDLARPETMAPLIQSVRPDFVVSAAAYTAVDQAEDEPDLAFAVNGAGPGEVARAAASVGAPIIHLSTDYVFDGLLDRPYREDDPTEPQGVYGASKLAGEEAVAAANPEAVILRTAWVYSPFGKNFVKTMLRLAGDRDEITVVSDQWGNPTSALDIADGILHVVRRLADGRSPERFGIFHLAGTGATNWSGLAERVMAASAENGGPRAAIRPILTAEFPTKARRPANSRLCTEKFARVYGWQAPQWEHSTGQTVLRLLEVAPAFGASS
jgi:dTDP-4-dehydrorhamnose reductase